MAHVTEDLFRNIECLLSYKLRGKKTKYEECIFSEQKTKSEVEKIQFASFLFKQQKFKMYKQLQKREKIYYFLITT